MIISHYRCFCADDGKYAKDTYDVGDGICCVDCPSELNEAGRKLMSKYGEYVYIERFAKGKLQERDDDILGTAD